MVGKFDGLLFGTFVGSLDVELSPLRIMDGSGEGLCDNSYGDCDCIGDFLPCGTISITLKPFDSISSIISSLGSLFSIIGSTPNPSMSMYPIFMILFTTF